MFAEQSYGYDDPFLPCEIGVAYELDPLAAGKVILGGERGVETAAGDALGNVLPELVNRDLAAEIASKIGAKSLLVRVGALYHDIGKMRHPVFFTENQAGINPHKRISETESAQVVISHVTEGLRMAEKENLPSVSLVVQHGHELGAVRL